MEKLKEVVQNILVNMRQNEEFEISFNKKKGVTEKEFLNLKSSFSEIPHKKIVSLDILMNDNRITIMNVQNINEFYKKMRYSKNTNIWNTALDTDDSVIIKKVNNNNIRKYLSSLDIQYKLSTEKKIDKKTPVNTSYETEDIHLIFRYKNRLSFIIEKNEYFELRLDMTIVQQSNSLVNILKKQSNIEIELEVFKFGDSKNTLGASSINAYFENTIKIRDCLQGIEATETTSSSSIQNTYLEIKNLYYRNLNHKKNGLYTMNPISLTKKTYLEEIPFNYSVTDKCDGSKVHLLIHNNDIYVFDNIMNIEKYSQNKFINNKTYIVEGEKTGERFLLYDIFVYENINITHKNLKGRLEHLSDFVKSMSNKKNFVFLDVDKNLTHNNDFPKVLQLYKTNMEQYIEHIKKSESIIERKYIITSSGLFGREEIYYYADLIWKTFNQMPYILDGIIFTNVHQSYEINLTKQKFPIYKWKPSEYNSIDFYIKFKKNENNENVLIKENDSLYRIIELYCYEKEKTKDILVPFKFKEGLHLAYIEEKDGSIFDIQNNEVNDNTIIEMVYNNSTINEKSRYQWSILRTRHDKTSYTRIHNKRFGNHFSVANQIFEIKLNPFELLDFSSQEKKKENVYYEKKSKIGTEMRVFHNHIKNMLIESYCFNKRVLDIGVGRGGDIQKYNRAKASFVVGMDISYMDLFHTDDSAIKRYSSLQKTDKENTVEMVFICGDFSLPLTITSQKKRYTDKNNLDNIKLYLKKSEKYDILNFSFSFHYLYNSDNNSTLYENINSKLKKNGNILITIFDGDTINEKITKGEYSESYINNEGEKKILFSIKKIDQSKINVYNSMYNEEGNYYAENIIFKDDLINNLNKACNCALVETMLFKDYIENNKDVLNILINSRFKKSKNEKSIQAFLNSESSLISASMNLSKLYRFYIFQKK